MASRGNYDANIRPAAWVLLAGVAFYSSAAQATPPTAMLAKSNGETLKDYTALSLSELADVEVTSVSKRSQKVSETASAVFVVTRDDMRRMGATSVPEALRMVPGLNVARAGSNEWAVSARGFNDQFANRLLVMVDGRTIYTSLFGGTFWDTQNFLLEDIDRIEVIRGPGGTMWGANAVNGVINIITKHSADTQGSLVKLRAGSQDKLMTAARYGGQVGEKGTYRAYVRHNEVDEMRLANGAGAGDESYSNAAGFRTDLIAGGDGADAVNLTFQGDLYALDENQNSRFPTASAPFSQQFARGNTNQGGNLLARATKKDGAGGEFNLQASYDMEDRNLYFLKSDIRTLDLDFTHSRPIGERHKLIWGLGYRNVDHEQSGDYVRFTPTDRNDNLFSGFLQDEYALIPQTLFFTAGTKIEHNDYTGVEVQPSARLSWLVDDHNTLWGAVSRAVKVPARFASDGRLLMATADAGGGNTLLMTNDGNPDVGVEDVIAYELGYRTQITNTLNVDISTFYNDYNNIILGQAQPITPFNDPILGPVLLQNFVAQNLGKATTYGFEVGAKYQATPNWQLTAGYSFLKMHLEGGAAFSATEGKSPQQQWNLRSDYNFGPDWEWSNAFYWVDELNPSPASTINAYLRFDSRVGWRPYEGVELSVVGQNLLDSQHPEFNNFLYQPAVEIGRAVYAQATFQF